MNQKSRSFMIRFSSAIAFYNPVTVRFKNIHHLYSLKSPNSSILTSKGFHSSPINFCQAKLYFPTMSVTRKQLLPHQSNNQQFTVCIEGNIGSGKTTLLNHLSHCSDVEVFQEPVDKWRNVRGMNMLDLMYQDPSRWAHLFQAHCFVENLYRTGKLSEPEYNVYCEWYKTISANLNINVDLIVFLSAAPSVVQERIKERGRAEESSIPLQYLEELDTLHRQWLHTDNLPAPLLVLPHSMTTAEMCAAVEKHISLICGGKADAPQSTPLIESKQLKAPAAQSTPLTESKQLKAPAAQSTPLIESKQLKAPEPQSTPLTESKQLIAPAAQSTPLTESKQLKAPAPQSTPLIESKQLKASSH